MKKSIVGAMALLFVLFISFRASAAEYTIKHGDTWQSVERALKVDAVNLAAFNKMSLKQQLVAQHVLRYVSQRDRWLAEAYCLETLKTLPITEAGRYRDMALFIRAGDIAYRSGDYGISASDVLEMAKWQEKQ